MTPTNNGMQKIGICQMSLQKFYGTAIGVGADLVLPPVARISAPIKAGARAVSGGRVFPRFDPQVIKLSFNSRTKEQRHYQILKLVQLLKQLHELEEEDEF